jgi:hypothetical protein
MNEKELTSGKVRLHEEEIGLARQLATGFVANHKEQEHDGKWEPNGSLWNPHALPNGVVVLLYKLSKASGSKEERFDKEKFSDLLPTKEDEQLGEVIREKVSEIHKSECAGWSPEEFQEVIDAICKLAYVFVDQILSSKLLGRSSYPLSLINPSPPDIECDCCGRHANDLAAFGGPGDPLVGNFKGNLLVERGRAMYYLSDERIKEKKEFEATRTEEEIRERYENDFGWQLSEQIQSSWECRDCIVLEGREYLEILRNRTREKSSSSPDQAYSFLTRLTYPWKEWHDFNFLTKNEAELQKRKLSELISRGIYPTGCKVEVIELGQNRSEV